MPKNRKITIMNHLIDKILGLDWSYLSLPSFFLHEWPSCLTLSEISSSQSISTRCINYRAKCPVIHGFNWTKTTFDHTLYTDWLLFQDPLRQFSLEGDGAIKEEEEHKLL